MSLFPQEYYACTAHYSKKKENWFCNRPLSPSKVQIKEVSSSDQSTLEEKNTNSINEFREISYSNIEIDQGISPESNTHEDSPLYSEDDTDKDPDYILETDSEIDSNKSRTSKSEVDNESSCSENDAIIPMQQLPCVNLENSTINSVRKGNKRKNFCFFCESYVLNFSSHLERNHAAESEVNKIFSMPTNSKERKKLLTIIRNKGNFLISNNHQIPVRKPVYNDKLLPCTNCLGFYSSKHLWRHRKKCSKSNDKCHQSNAQNFMLKNLKVDAQLRDKIFPRMRPDEVSLVAKKDVLICAFGARYMKIHREKHYITVTSRKMRELSKLLIELKKLNDHINTFLDALKPQYYDNLVQATKTVARFDDKKEFYGAPSYALNMGTTLKQCCEIAITFALKRKEIYLNISAAEAEADLKTLILLIESHWKYDISAQAANDLNMNSWNKITIVPLASDLKTLNNFLLLKGESAATKIKNSSDNKSYKILLETIFCRVLLLNRRRPGELQRLPLHIYEQVTSTNQTYEEFSSIISLSERVLLKKFKRVVIRGKRGRGVPVLFSEDVQKHIEIMLQYRKSHVNKNNIYLFGNPTSAEPICGYKCLKKYAELSGIKNPHAITATKLRKYLATLSQIFSMSEGDIEQLATFMGHTVNIHKNSYRLPNDVFQTAKISKLLMLMEKGEANMYKGKTLDEIDINLEDELLQNGKNDENNENILNERIEIDCENSNVENTLEDKINKIDKIENKLHNNNKRTLIPWNNKQKDIVKQFFKEHIKNKRPPKKDECVSLKNEYPEILQNKDWQKIKVYVQNEYMKKKKPFNFEELADQN